MVRLSKQKRRRLVSFRRRRTAGIKTGPKKDHLPLGFKKHENAVSGDLAASIFIPRI